MSQMNVQIVTPDGLVYDHHAAFVSVKTIDGELGILPHHINTIAVLAVDQVKVPNCELKKRLKKPKISIRLIWNVVLKLLFNAPLTGLMSEIVYNIFKIRWRFCPHLIFVGRESKEESTDQIWYNSCMIQMIFNLSSHLLFIFFAYYLLMNLVQWEKFLKVSAENAVKIRFLILMISVGIGYLASSFFISVYEMSRQIFIGQF